MKAMIFAAGMGTRLRPLTERTPKALIGVAGMPMIGRLIQKLKAFGIDQIIINIHHFPEQIEAYLKKNKDFDIEIVISDERSDLMDTGGGLKRAKWFLDGNSPFILHNVDVFSDINLQKMISFHQQQKPIATLAVRHRNSSRFLLFDNQMKLNGWQNKKTNETILVNIPTVPLKRLAFSGIHVIDPEIFELLDEEGPFRIIDSYLDIASTERIMGFEDSNGYFVDMGTVDGLKQAEKIIKASEE
ncbi:MAG: nucleotidyltransferase family protein [Bacteroidota bacterium]|nr:nucleotidyltransferase family protein [Bacteroidota bacterium]